MAKVNADCEPHSERPVNWTRQYRSKEKPGADAVLLKGSCIPFARVYGTPQNPEQVNDVRLIVNAPELYAALVELLEQTIMADESYGVSLTEGEAHAADRARAVLHKAKPLKR